MKKFLSKALRIISNILERAAFKLVGFNITDIPFTQGTFFHGPNGKQIASEEGIIPIQSGWLITIHGFNNQLFKAGKCIYHNGHPDEEAGLHIYLEDVMIL